MSVIRPVQPCDIAAVREALVASWHATYDPILGPQRARALTDAWHAPQTLAGEIDLPDGAFLLAEDGGRVVGSALARIDDAGEICLRRLYLLPEAQGTGLGTRLLEEALERLGPRPAWLEVKTSNLSAIGFYASRGFAAQESQETCGGSDLACALVMRRQPGLRLRRAKDRDAQDLFGLVTLCFAEYPGCYTDPHDDMADLTRPAHTAAGRDMLFLVVEDEDGRVKACIALGLSRCCDRRICIGCTSAPTRAGRGSRVPPRRHRRSPCPRPRRHPDHPVVRHPLRERARPLRESRLYACAPETRELGDVSGSGGVVFFEKGL